MATRILTDFLAEMKEVLKVRKTVVFPGLGRLRATRENHFFFVADEDLDIYPEGLGLAPLSLKTHTETPEEVASAVAGLAGLISDTVPSEPLPVDAFEVVVDEPAPVPELEPVEEIPEQVGNDEPEVEPEPEPEAEEISPLATLGRNDNEEPEQEPEPEPVVEIPEQVGNDEAEVEPEPEPEAEEISPRAALGRNDSEEPESEPEPKPRRRWWVVLLIVLCALLVLFVAFILIGRFAPNLIDSLLYSKEELEILRYQ